MVSVTTAASSQDASVASARPRLLYIDNIRTILITLVVVGHMGITYGGPGDWYYHETGTSNETVAIIMLLLAAIVKASLLGLFCLIAGYFTVPAYDRKGARAFLVDRVKRLLIPLAIYEFVINPVINYVRDVHQGAFQGSFISFLQLFFSPLRSIGDGPVWFLLMLFIFSVGYTTWRLVVTAARPPSDPMALGAPGNAAIALFALVLGFSTFIVRIWAPVGRNFEPWHQELAAYSQYVLMFVVGVLAYRGQWLSGFPDARARLWRWLTPLIIVSLGGVVVAGGALSGAMDERVVGGVNWISLSYSMWEAWTCVILAVVMLTWFRARFDYQGTLARKMAAAAFAVYVIHPGIIVPLAIALSGITMNLSLKFLLVTPVAVALCYLAAELLRRLPGVRSIV
jgi:glucans biosynthesis protein C